MKNGVKKTVCALMAMWLMMSVVHPAALVSLSAEWDNGDAWEEGLSSGSILSIFGEWDYSQNDDWLDDTRDDAAQDEVITKIPSASLPDDNSIPADKQKDRDVPVKSGTDKTQKTDIVANGSISGCVWADDSGSGNHQNNPLPGFEVLLYRAADLAAYKGLSPAERTAGSIPAPIQKDITNHNGVYRFTGLTADQYVLAVSSAKVDCEKYLPPTILTAHNKFTVELDFCSTAAITSVIVVDQNQTITHIDAVMRHWWEETSDQPCSDGQEVNRGDAELQPLPETPVPDEEMDDTDTAEDTTGIDEEGQDANEDNDLFNISEDINDADNNDASGESDDFEMPDVTIAPDNKPYNMSDITGESDITDETDELTAPKEPDMAEEPGAADTTDESDVLDEPDEPDDTDIVYGAVSGFLWVDGGGMPDTNGDGFYNGNERPLTGYTVALYTEDDALGALAVTQTNEWGVYLFSSLTAGSYFLQIESSETDDTGYLVPFVLTYLNKFTSDLTNDSSGARTLPIDLSEGQLVEHISAGLLPYVLVKPDEEQPDETEDEPDEALPGSISGFLWADISDMPEPDEEWQTADNKQPLTNYLITLYSADDMSEPLETTHTDVNGQYSFDTLEPGAYVLGLEAQPLPDSEDTELVLPSALSEDNNFSTGLSDNFSTAFTPTILLAEGQNVRGVNGGLMMLAAARNNILLGQIADAYDNENLKIDPNTGLPILVPVTIDKQGWYVIKKDTTSVPGKTYYLLVRQGTMGQEQFASGATKTTNYFSNYCTLRTTDIPYYCWAYFPTIRDMAVIPKLPLSGAGYSTPTATMVTNVNPIPKTDVLFVLSYDEIFAWNGGRTSPLRAEIKAYGQRFWTRTAYDATNVKTINVDTNTTLDYGVIPGATNVYLVVAVWVDGTIPVDPFKITYIANNGTSQPDFSELTPIENGVIQPLTIRTRETVEPAGFSPPYGYVFKEWNTQANGSGTVYTPGTGVTLDADLVLYAIWVMTPPMGVDEGSNTALLILPVVALLSGAMVMVARRRRRKTIRVL